MINLRDWKINKSYNYGREIEPVLDVDGHEYTEHNMTDDRCFIGRSFVSVVDENENVLSFVVDGHTGFYGASMKLIYKG